jgi:hypothetical protein
MEDKMDNEVLEAPVYDSADEASASMYDEVLAALGSEGLTKTQMKGIMSAISDALYPDEDWRIAGDPTKMLVGDREFSLRFRGKRQLAVMKRLRSWLTDHVTPALELAGGTKALEGGDLASGMKTIAAMLEPDIFVELGSFLSGQDEEWVMKHFDLGWIITALESAYNSNSFIKRIASAFFTKGD